jgi:hypothetical protein
MVGNETAADRQELTPNRIIEWTVPVDSRENMGRQFESHGGLLQTLIHIVDELFLCNFGLVRCLIRWLQNVRKHLIEKSVELLLCVDSVANLYRVMSTAK